MKINGSESIKELSRVVADTLPALTSAIDNESIPPQETIIRLMDKEEKKFNSVRP